MPFQIQSNYTGQIPEILFALDEWEKETPIQFVPATSGARIVFRRSTFDEPNACFAELGYNGGIQYVDLAEVCERYSIIHEIGHSLGFKHEQQRGDRNNTINVIFSNIIDKWEYAYNIESGNWQGAYNVRSVMHYFIGQLCTISMVHFVWR